MESSKQAQYNRSRQTVVALFGAAETLRLTPSTKFEFSVISSQIETVMEFSRSKYSFIYSSPKWIFVLVAANIIILTIWSFYLISGTRFRDSIGKDIEVIVASIIGLNVERSAVAVSCTKVCNSFLHINHSSQIAK